MHNLKEGMVIMHQRLNKIKFMNVAARQMLDLPFEKEIDSAGFASIDTGDD